MNNTLANGLHLLGFLSRTAESFGVSELATHLKLPKSHIHRLLQTLLEAGYVIQTANRRYAIGLRSLEISCALLQHMPLRIAARPFLHLLAERTGMDTYAAIPHPDGYGLVVSVIYPNGQQRDPMTSIGLTLKEGTASYKVLAACMPGFAKHALSSRELARIRRERFAIRNPALSGPEINSMAALVRDRSGVVHGTLSLSADGDTFRRRAKRASVALRAAADKLGADFESHVDRTAAIPTPKA